MKKYIYYLVILISILLCSIYNISAQSFVPLMGKLVVVDPGHGGADPGTVFGDIYEKDINLKISRFLKNELEKYGASIIMTREDDYDLSRPNAVYRKKSDFDNRIRLINQSKADIYISIHLNYLDDASYFGPQVFYNKGNQKLAEHLQKKLNNYTTTDRNIKLIPTDTYMYSRLNLPGILIECGFLSNMNERNRLITTTYQQKLAEIIAQGIVTYFT
ncbi:MAG: N-acetylmuramoyl-L-alanine amidase CwlD [Firmicutes bacterium]|nr:N-acetylmuramoyl-L-alanine amidase CwlD [Bacillota bacterium]